MEDIISVVDILSGVDTKTSKGTIIRQYRPNSIWLWRQWSGTMLQYVWPSCLSMMVVTLVYGLLFSYSIAHLDIDDQNEIHSHVNEITAWWKSLQPLTTFVTTFCE